VLGRASYVGLAPVPGGRINVGIVVPANRLRLGVESVISSTYGDGHAALTLDEPQVAGRLEHHTKRAAGDGWLLVGDAIEFIDPLTGEGLHRALVTAHLASEAIHAWLSGLSRALADYDRRVRSRFRSKNVLSLVLQAFIADPRVLDYALRRLDARPALRAELTGVLTDQVVATNALDPRFMARLLRP
jgi:flavin-dependent dehydrogenase